MRHLKHFNVKYAENISRNKGESQSSCKVKDIEIADGHLHDLFPIRNKYHPMKRRVTKRYKEFHAHTERYKNSPILAMQRMLNNET